MGSLILCHNVKAIHGFEIPKVHSKICTLEELCYFLVNNLYLIDETIVHLALARWIENELKLVSLGENLRRILEGKDPEEKFVIEILRGSGMYPNGELMRIQNQLEKMKGENPLVKLKKKGDCLLENGQVREAILVFHQILARPKSDMDKFYGQVYGSLGAAYGKAFLYKEAAKMYEQAYEQTKKAEYLNAYVYANKMFLDKEAYMFFLEGNTKRQEIDAMLNAQEERCKEQIVSVSADEIETWMSTYRAN